MWSRYEGPFILPPRHAAVFRAAAARLSDDIGWRKFEDEWVGIGVRVFDDLTQGQKQAAILEVAKALLDSSIEPPRVTGVLGGTVDAIYRELEGNIEIEMDFDEETTLRQMVLDALAEIDYWNQVNSGLGAGEEPVLPLAPDSTDTKDWAELVEGLRMEVLEDYDFDMEDTFLDMPPAAAAELKRSMNILPDYFTAVPEDPKPERLAEIQRALRTLLR